FQAEVGFRDFHVTGVQTYALPICPLTVGQGLHTDDESRRVARRLDHVGDGVAELLHGAMRDARRTMALVGRALDAVARRRRTAQIGRASCREQEWNGEALDGWIVT